MMIYPFHHALEEQGKQGNGLRGRFSHLQSPLDSAYVYCRALCFLGDFYAFRVALHTTLYDKALQHTSFRGADFTKPL